MSLEAGLYYPYVHVRDDAWLKGCALIWRELRRIAPQDYPIQDSATAQAFSECNFLTVAEPYLASYPVGLHFGEFVVNNADTLRERFGPVDHHVTSDGKFDTRGRSPRVGYIHRAKIPQETIDILIEAGLSTHSSARGNQWVPLPWELASAYMAGLAQHIADNYHLALLTDSKRAFDAVGTSRPNEILGVPNDRTFSLNGDHNQTPDRLLRVAQLAIRVAVPSGLGIIPASQIISFRERNENLLGQFREGMAEITRKLDDLPPDVVDDEVRVQIDGLVKREIEDPLRALEDELRWFGKPLIRQVMTVQSSTAVGGLSGAAIGHFVQNGPANTILGGSVGVALTALANIHVERSKLLREQSKVNYLLKMKNELPHL